MSDPIVIVDCSPGWPLEFERLRDRVAAAVGNLAIAIEHVGSTAVPGLAAKPVIDFVIVVDPEDVQAGRFRDDRTGYTDAKTAFVTATSQP